jgi:hypothetical protein
VVRHAVEQGWTVRVVLANESDAPLVLEQVRLGWRAVDGTVVTALAAGAQAAYAVQPVGGDGPVLVGRLRSGAQPGVDEAGFLLGPLVLAPRHRWAVAWRWEVVPDLRRPTAADLPRTTWLDLGQTLVLPGGPDVAVVAPGLAVETEEDRVEVAAPEPGTSVVELRSARGTTAYALTWAPDLDDLVDHHVEALLTGPTTPAGTLRLPDAAAGLVVQDAVARRSAGAGEELADALELPFQVLELAGGDLGLSATRKYDCYAWLPTQQRYREITSTSNCTEFQARRLNIRGRFADGVRPVATLNGTLCAMARMIIMILENHQQADGTVRVPVALRPYLGGREALTPLS